MAFERWAVTQRLEQRQGFADCSTYSGERQSRKVDSSQHKGEN